MVLFSSTLLLISIFASWHSVGLGARLSTEADMECTQAGRIIWVRYLGEYAMRLISWAIKQTHNKYIHSFIFV